jgi:IclR family transcriptional regulator, acetate operon repressor
VPPRDPRQRSGEPQPNRAATTGVRSLERAFELLEHLADGGGELTLSELAEAAGLPMPTAYRLIRTLVDGGYVRQGPTRRYALGPRLIRLGEAASRLLGTRARPVLAELVEEVGETANMALLEGDEAVYVAQVPSRHSVRMFTEVGRRVKPHCTGVGKALLAQLPPGTAGEILGRTGLPAATHRTITDPATLMAELDRIRTQGYALDDEEQELGVRCVAVPVAGAPALAAISVSGPQGRLTRDVVDAVVPIMKRTADRLARRLADAP